MMSSDIESLYKILKDQENRKMLLLLNEKGALTYAELMDFFVGTHMLNYRLKVLSDFLAKNDEDKYVLSEDGKIAYKMLNELPENAGVSKMEN